MLLWLEYANELSPKERSVLAQFYESADESLSNTESLSDAIQTRLVEFRDYIPQEEFSRIYKDVKNFVLPAIEIVEQQFDTQIDQNPGSLSW